MRSFWPDINKVFQVLSIHFDKIDLKGLLHYVKNTRFESIGVYKSVVTSIYIDDYTVESKQQSKQCRRPCEPTPKKAKTTLP